MRKFLLLLATISLVTGITAAPSSALSASSVATKAKVTAPLAPTIKAISSSAVKKGKVDVKVTITLPTSNGGSTITGSKVSAGGKTCTISKTKTSCTIKSISNGKSLSVYANSKNIKGYGAKSARVTYAAGASAWSATPAAPAVSVVADAPAAAAPAPAAALTCAEGGTCVVGNTGPGGGIVYYVDTAGFSCGSGFTATGSPTGGKCNYLEAAPSLWNGGADPTKPWAVTANQSTGVTVITDEASVNNSSTGIGLGLKNSIAIVAQNGAYDATSNNYAAGAARAYAGNSKSDWYLPTTAELNLLCQWGRNVTQVVGTACTGGTLNTGTGASGGFVGDVYWSSSEYDAVYAWGQVFGSGNRGHLKHTTLYVRPVRAF